MHHPPYQQLTSPQHLHQLLQQNPTSLLILNSLSPSPPPIPPPPPPHPLHYHKLPQPLLTLFPAQDKHATQQPTRCFQPYPPSTPS
ncbi:BrxA/BrxB family bacilliredoxin, partial [Staphylococcus epidermidis]|uniref:BrxA/BrxB family bacilliredoxin n=1 Tax=Staphylococcus epidermidis TaxID=1282 RepID=UPI0037DA7621